MAFSSGRDGSGGWGNTIADEVAVNAGKGGLSSTGLGLLGKMLLGIPLGPLGIIGGALVGGTSSLLAANKAKGAGSNIEQQQEAAKNAPSGFLGMAGNVVQGQPPWGALPSNPQTGVNKTDMAAINTAARRSPNAAFQNARNRGFSSTQAMNFAQSVANANAPGTPQGNISTGNFQTDANIDRSLLDAFDLGGGIGGRRGGPSGGMGPGGASAMGRGGIDRGAVGAGLDGRTSGKEK